ncbi:filamentous hemagglutinin N-terminal domain-containing protein [Nostoc sp. XA010]|uniref:two-partner secretion domain-containing protein n=1 Tax=Nostoc sp. XA010 TaxID=2780407 RepID=UPI001E32B792|nr:filamentous hemagglutinin N-terminal domain-containing protein [Nostoc sp. XA010]MCC5659384.1 filamentous hemagglutinin N-terminal domain-containing protein [Nostoc sp. XA010]
MSGLGSTRWGALVTIALGVSFCTIDCAIAQITPDGTLPNNTRVTREGDTFNITGGTQAGGNLFHSFGEFSVPTNGAASFNNAVDIQNIISRVTGGSVSNIDGLIRANGTANLFLINPSGIIFGKNASLDIRGAFTATTANEIKLGEKGLFSATEPAKSNLLTIQPNALFVNALKNQQAQINNQANLTVGEGKNITLFGANVSNTGILTAQNGTINLTGAENLIVRGNLDTNTLLLNTKNITIAENTPDNSRATIYKSTVEGLSGNTNIILQATNDITIKTLSGNSLNLANGSGKVTFNAGVDGDGIGNFQMQTADTIKTNGRDIGISGASLTLGTIDTKYDNLGGGNITLTATEGNISTQSLQSFSYSSYDTAGNGGEITLTAQGNISTLDLDSFSYSSYDTAGNGGEITLTAQGNISTLDLDSYSRSDYDRARNGGEITLTAQGNISTLDLDSSSFSGSVSGTGGNGGDITLTAQGNIFTQFLNSISSSYYGNGGDITVTAQGDISTQQQVNSYSYSSDEGTTAAGNSGDITLTAQGNIFTRYLNSSSPFGTGGNSGDITVTAQGNISTESLNSNSSSTYGTAGNAGDITLTAQGNISTESVNSYSYSSYGTAAGNGGDITVNAQGNISTLGELDSSSYSPYGTAGNGGRITLTAQGDIKGTRYYEDVVTVFSSFSVSKTRVSGQGGNVTLAAKNQITDLEILTLSSNSKSGDVQIKGFGDLSLTNTDIITSKQVTIKNRFLGEDTILDVAGVGQSGNVTVSSTGNLTFNNSRIESDARGSDPPGNITITSPSTVTFNNNNISKITSNTSSQGQAGNIQINANNLVLTDASEISASTTADGKAGDITLNTPTLTVANAGKIFATTTGIGDGGTITINAPNKVNLGIGVQDFTPILSVETSGAGKAGDIIVNTPNLTVSDTARITATATKTATNTQGGGSITLNASKIDLAGIVGVFAETRGEAPAGTLKLNPYQNQPDLDITLFPSSIISASTSASGKGGDLILAAPETINIAGQGKLTVESTGTGDAGNIQITTQKLDINDGVQISASTNNIGKGGNIQVNANNLIANNGAQFLTATSGNAQAGNINLEIRDQISLSGTDTGLFANTEKGSIGYGGNINLITNDFSLSNGGRVSTSSEGEGKAGDININSGSTTLDNQGFIAAASNSGDGGNINLTVDDLLLLRGGSEISTTAGTDQKGGNGGNININAPNGFIVAVPGENSDITANAFTGKGGRVHIKANGIYGIKFRESPTLLSDITASSEFGTQGTVELNTPGIDPNSGLVELPTMAVETEVAQVCDSPGYAQSSFIITGSGGLPPNPTKDVLPNGTVEVGWVSLKPSSDANWRRYANGGLRRSSNPPLTTKALTPTPEPIVEASGWAVNKKGEVVLTANLSAGGRGSWHKDVPCSATHAHQ